MIYYMNRAVRRVDRQTQNEEERENWRKKKAARKNEKEESKSTHYRCATFSVKESGDEVRGGVTEHNDRAEFC